jgi:hypothetical protein
MLNLRCLDVDEPIEPERFDLIVLFYYFDRRLFPKLVAALKPGGLILRKLGVRWDSETRLSAVADPLIERNELLSILPKFHVINLGQRLVSENRGVVEYAGRKLCNHG